MQNEAPAQSPLTAPNGAPATPVTATSVPADRSAEFRPIEGGPEGTSAGALLVAAYIVFWALVLAFVALNARRSKLIGERLRALEVALEAHEKRMNAGSKGGSAA
jgi:hypothetical protein